MIYIESMHLHNLKVCRNTFNLSYINITHAWSIAINNKASSCFNGCINEVFNNRATSLMGPLFRVQALLMRFHCISEIVHKNLKELQQNFQFI